MKLLFFVFILGCQSMSSAEVLLIPGAEVPFSDYKDRCAGSGYSCTTDYFLRRLKSHTTPEFDHLIDSVDLSSEKFRDRFRNTIIGILNSEDLDRMQLALLIRVTQQVNSIEPTFVLRSVQHELERIQSEIAAELKLNTTVHKDEFILIFKEIFPLAKAEKLRTTFLKIPLYVIHFSSIPVKSSSFDYKRFIRKPLLKESCGKNALIYSIETRKYCNKQTTDSESAKELNIIRGQRY